MQTLARQNSHGRLRVRPAHDRIGSRRSGPAGGIAAGLAGKGGHLISALNQLVDLVEEHLCEELDVHPLAGKLGTTEYHLRRMFSSLAGMPLSEASGTPNRRVCCKSPTTSTTSTPSSRRPVSGLSSARPDRIRRPRRRPGPRPRPSGSPPTRGACGQVPRSSRSSTARTTSAPRPANCGCPSNRRDEPLVPPRAARWVGVITGDVSLTGVRAGAADLTRTGGPRPYDVRHARSGRRSARSRRRRAAADRRPAGRVRGGALVSVPVVGHERAPGARRPAGRADPARGRLRRPPAWHGSGWWVSSWACC